jgi:hypothetical protein
MVAIPGALLLQVPPESESVKVIESPIHTVVGPPIILGRESIVNVSVMPHPRSV